MSLPYDYARCHGRMVKQNIPGTVTAVTISHGQAECVRCLRRTSPGSPDGPQPKFVELPPLVDGKCPKREAPETWEKNIE